MTELKGRGKLRAMQSSILAPLPPCGRFITLSLKPGVNPVQFVEQLRAIDVGDGLIIGLGAPLAGALKRDIPGFTPLAGKDAAFPSTQGAIWACLLGPDAGHILHRARAFVAAFRDWTTIEEDVASFTYDTGRDLSGYEDGTENPTGTRASEVAFNKEGGAFVLTQRWVHSLETFNAMNRKDRDHTIGRDIESNAELADAPPSAHVKRTAQESFDPPSFMVRRSMPWGDTRELGLYFVAYAASVAPIDRVLRRMIGLEDGVTDALFRFTHPVTGSYFWCPPLEGGHLALT